MLFSEPRARDTVPVSEGSLGNSFYSEAIEMSMALTEDWYNLRHKMMACETEAIIAEDASLLSEGGREFFSKMAEFFRRIWGSVKRMWDRFTGACSRAFSSDEKFVRKYKSLIREKNLAGMTYRGYKYTIDEFVPRYQPESEFIKAPDADGMTAATVENYRSLVADESHYDTVRGKVIGMNTPIPYDDFDAELVRVFRDGEEKEEDHEMDGATANQLIQALEDKDELKKCQKLKDDIDKFYSAVVSYFENAGTVRGDEFIVNSFTVDGTSMTRSDDHAFKFRVSEEEKVRLVRGLANVRAEEARRISAIYNAAFGAKLDAIKERRVEARRVLSQAVAYRKEE